MEQKDKYYQLDRILKFNKVYDIVIGKYLKGKIYSMEKFNKLKRDGYNG